MRFFSITIDMLQILFEPSPDITEELRCFDYSNKQKETVRFMFFTFDTIFVMNSFQCQAYIYVMYTSKEQQM